MQTEKEDKKDRTRKAIYMRFTDEEYKKINKESARRGLKIQNLLKGLYFNSNGSLPLMPKEECDQLLIELKRIGININQIAKKTNSGFRTDWSNSFDEAVAELNKLRKVVMNYVAS